MAVTGVNNDPTAPVITGTRSGAEVSREDFLKLLIAEVSNQDPLKPLDNAQFLTQLTQLETLSGNTKLTESVKALLRQQQIASAGTMLGAVVRGFADGGFPVQGTVTGVTIAGDEVSLTLEGAIQVKLDQVAEILLPAPASPTGGVATPPSTGTPPAPLGTAG